MQDDHGRARGRVLPDGLGTLVRRHEFDILTQVMRGSRDILACSFFDEVRRIGAQGYEPTDDDVLHAWETSVGIRETAVATGDMACVYCLFVVCFPFC